MGRESIYRIGEQERKTAKKTPVENSPSKTIPTEIIIVEPKDQTKKYGYDTPQRRELKGRLDSILQEDPQKLVKKSVAIYGERMVASLVADGSTADLNSWLENPVNHTLKGKTHESLVRIGITIDFADQMEKGGKTKEEIRKTWQERQPLFNNLSLSSAVSRVGHQYFGLIHELSERIANGDDDIKNEKDEAIRAFFEEDYTLPEDDRGH